MAIQVEEPPGPRAELQVGVARQGAAVTIELTGDLVKSTAHWLDENVDIALTSHPGRLTVDLRGVTAFDDAGWRALERVLPRGLGNGCEILIRPRPRVVVVRPAATGAAGPPDT